MQDLTSPAVMAGRRPASRHARRARRVVAVGCLAAACVLDACAPSEHGIRPAAAASVAHGARASAEPFEDCDLSTPLVPGVPGSPGHLIVSARNPNGDSELAHLMRDMVDELLAARAALEGGEAPAPLFPSHRRMRCAWPTTPDQRNAVYDAMARGYLQRVEAFDAEPSRVAYNAIVQDCTACHAVSCSGPLDFIEGLAWR